MKLAEALVLRADKKKRIEQLKMRILRNAKVQEGESPAEDPEALLQELEIVCADLERLIQQINRTNTANELAPGVSLADAIATRDMLLQKHTVYRDLAQSATITPDLRTKSEIKFRSTVRVVQIQERADLLAQKHRELDTRIQEINWRIELI